MAFRARKQCHPVRAYFSYIGEDDTSECIIKVGIQICGYKCKGHHATNLERHMSLKHPNEYCELSSLKVCEKRRRSNSDTVNCGAKKK